jgi:hypothetical protein
LLLLYCCVTQRAERARDEHAAVALKDARCGVSGLLLQLLHLAAAAVAGCVRAGVSCCGGAQRYTSSVHHI